MQSHRTAKPTACAGDDVDFHVGSSPVERPM
jgi:hypothetical protein